MSDRPAKSGRSRAPLPRPRIWFLRIATAVVVPLAILLLVESGLRQFGYGVSVDFFERARVGDADRFLSNPDFGRAFFPPQLRRECLPFSLPVKKEPGTVRIFLLGASAANGVPEPAYGMARILETMLREEHPGVEFEVVNVAITAVNSHVVHSIAKACRKLDPDLFLVYLGNNEVVGPYGAGTVFSPLAKSVGMIRFDIALKSTRIGQLMNSITRRVFSREDEPAGWRGMEMFLANQVRASDPKMDLVYRHFERNLQDVCGIAADAEIPVILSTVGVNLRHSGPFASLHDPRLSPEDVRQFDALVERGLAEMDAGNLDAAWMSFREAEDLDAEYAELHFLMGRCSWEMGDFDAATARFERARDLDTLRFRADTRIEEIIRRVAEERQADGAHLVDTERALAATSENGAPGRELFHEHVHLNFAGNYHVARAFFETVSRVLPDEVRRHAAARPVLSEEECARRLAYTAWDQAGVLGEVYSMVQGPPFIDQIDHDEQVAYVEQRRVELEQRVTEVERREAASVTSGAVSAPLQEMARVYEVALLEHDTHWLLRHRYAKFQMDALRQPVVAEQHWRRLMSELPQFALAPSYLAGALAAQTRYAEALDLWRRSLAMNPYQSDVHNNVGNCLRLLRPDDRETRLDAIDHYRTSYAMAPSENGRRNLNQALFDESLWLLQREQLVEGKVLLLEIVDSDPDFPEAHFNLGGIHEREGDREGALRHYREVLRILPNHEEARRRVQGLRG